MGKRVQKLLIYIFIRVSRDVVVPPLGEGLENLSRDPCIEVDTRHRSGQSESDCRRQHCQPRSRRLPRHRCIIVSASRRITRSTTGSRSLGTRLSLASQPYFSASAYALGRGEGKEK